MVVPPEMNRDINKKKGQAPPSFDSTLHGIEFGCMLHSSTNEGEQLVRQMVLVLKMQWAGQKTRIREEQREER